jgi:FkbM family methyltransferase
MLQCAKKQIKRWAACMGYKLYPKNSLHCPTHQLLTAINYLGINTVIDIGANVGQFSQSLIEEGFKGKIISFEPLKDAHKKLTKLATKYPNWTIAPPLAIGQSEQRTTINVCSRSSCSSLLRMLETHSKALPDAQTTHQETILVQSLDNALKSYVSPSNIETSLIKIDVQGYEWEVFKGAQKVLKKAKAIFCETSLTPLFENQKLWGDVTKFLESHNFKVWAVQKAFVNESKGEDLQLNILFVRD